MQAEPGIAGYDTSVRTGRTMDEIASGDDGQLARNPFERSDVELAKLVASAPKGDGWLYEVKYDGTTACSAFVEENRARLVSRNGKDYTGHFPAIADELALDCPPAARSCWTARCAMIDADGRTDFQALQNCPAQPRRPRSLPTSCSTLLRLTVLTLRDRSLLERKEALEQLLEGARPPTYATAATCAGTARTACAPPASFASRAWWASAPTRPTAACATAIGSS